MPSNAATAPVLRTFMACATVAFLGYLGFLLLRPSVAKGPDVTPAPSVAKELGVTPATQQELWHRSLKIWRLHAAYNEAQDRIRVSGKLACQAGEWQSVTISFVFRGPNNVANHQENYAVPVVSEKTPLRPGIVKEFAFEIPKFDRPWEEHHVEARVEHAEPSK